MKFHITRESSNKKTGPIPVSTSPSSTCPPTCPWKEKGCYGKTGPLRFHWNKVSNKDRGISWKDFIQEVSNLPEGQLWRHNQVGDLAGSKGKVNTTKLMELANANVGKRGFTYTHYKVEGYSKNAITNRANIRAINKTGFVINLSGDNLDHADRLFALEIAPVTTILPSDTITKTLRTPMGNKVVVCPAALRDDTTCSTCQLCAQSKRNYIIGFPAHGTQKGHINIKL